MARAKTTRPEGEGDPKDGSDAGVRTVTDVSPGESSGAGQDGEGNTATGSADRNPTPEIDDRAGKETITSSPPQAQVADRRSGFTGGFAGLLLGGMAAAALGAGATIVILPHLGVIPADPVPETGVRDLEASVSELKATIAGIAPSLDELKSSVGSADAALAARLDAVEARVASLDSSAASLSDADGRIGARLEELDTRLATLEKRPGPGGTVPSAAIEAFQRDLDALRSDLAAQKEEVRSARDALAAATADAAAQIQSMRAEALRMQDEARAAAARTAAAAALSHLQAALQSGVPIGPALAELAAAGIEVPSDLKEQQGGIPTLDFLKAAFPNAAREALAAARRAAPAGTWTERLTNFLSSQTNARSLTPKAGNDPDAILSRAEAALTAGDLPAALAEIEALPEPARAVLSEWAGLAGRRVAAVKAVESLSQLAQ